MPSALDSVIASRAKQENFNGFLPSEEAYSSALDAQIEDIFSRLPVGRENFEADLASRGIRGSGEATKFLYSDVYAPIARQAALATSQSKLSYFQAFQTGSIAAANLNFNYTQLQSSRELEQQRIEAEKRASLFEAIGGLIGTGVGAFADIKTAGTTAGG